MVKLKLSRQPAMPNGRCRLGRSSGKPYVGYKLARRFGLGNVSFYWCIGESAAGDVISTVCLLPLKITKAGQERDKTLETKKALQRKRRKALNLLVPGPGIEPGTHGFSVRCSTD